MRVIEWGGRVFASNAFHFQPATPPILKPPNPYAPQLISCITFFFTLYRYCTVLPGHRTGRAPGHPGPYTLCCIDCCIALLYEYITISLVNSLPAHPRDDVRARLFAYLRDGPRAPSPPGTPSMRDGGRAARSTGSARGSRRRSAGALRGQQEEHEEERPEERGIKWRRAAE